MANKNSTGELESKLPSIAEIISSEQSLDIYGRITEEYPAVDFHKKIPHTDPLEGCFYQGHNETEVVILNEEDVEIVEGEYPSEWIDVSDL